MIVPKLESAESVTPMDPVTLTRQKLANRVEEEKLAISIRDFYPKDSEEWVKADKEVRGIHDRVMALTMHLRGLTLEQTA